MTKTKALSFITIDNSVKYYILFDIIQFKLEFNYNKYFMFNESVLEYG